MIYGYVRISTKQQSIDRQIRNIKAAYPDAVIVQEAYTGTTMERPLWNRLFNRVKEGDIIVFDSVSRMSRNAKEGTEIYFELFDKGVDLLFLKEPQINTTTYKKARHQTIPLTRTCVDYILEGINKYLVELAKQQIRLAFEVSQKEVDDLHQRTKEGLETARLLGRTLGHRKGEPVITQRSIKAKELILKHSKDFGGALNDVDVIRLCGCSRKSFYKYKKELKEKEL